MHHFPEKSGKGGTGKIAVLIPALNEADNIDLLLPRILSILPRISPGAEILVIDGGSVDGTRERIEAWAGQAPVRLVKSDGGRGLAGDILVGAQQTDAEMVVVMDADLSHPPEALPELIRPILSGTRDMVIGSRYLPDAAVTGWPWRRKAASRLATAMAWPLASASDPLSGFFAVRRQILLDFGRNASGFKIALEILARADDGLRLAEVPISFTDRRHGQSKMEFKVAAAFLRQLVTLAGGAVSQGNALRFALVGLLGMGIDALVFNFLLSAEAGLVTAHLIGFLAATLFNYHLGARWAFRATAMTGEGRLRYLRFFTICLLALFLRGAVLTILVEMAAFPPHLAIFAAIATAALVNYIGTAFFIFPPPSARATPGLRWRVFAGTLVLYALVLRVLFAGIVDLIPEEAYYWNYARHLDIGYLDHPPMVAWLIWTGTFFFGHTEFAIRLPAILCGLATMAFTYRQVKELHGKTAAFAAAAMIALLPIYFFTGMLMTPDAPLYAAWAGSLYFLHHALVLENRHAWLPAGLCLGIGLLSKYTIGLLAVAALLFMLLDRRSRKWLRHPYPYLAVLLAALLFSPVLAWNLDHEWASFSFQGTRRWSGLPSFHLQDLAGFILVQLTPVGLVAFAGAMLARRPPTADRRSRLFAVVFLLLPLAVFILHSLQGRPKLNWTGPVWLAGLPLLAASLTRSGRYRFSRFSRWTIPAWKPTMVGLALIFGVFMYYMQIGMPGSPQDENMSLPVAWEELQHAVDGIEKQLKAKTGSEPVLVGLDKYFLASQLAFYAAKNGEEDQTAGRSLFGGSSLMWGLWMPPEAVIGRDVILLGFKSESLEKAALERYFWSLEPVEMTEIRKSGRVVGRIYYRIGYGYQVAPALLSQTGGSGSANSADFRQGLL